MNESEQTTCYLLGDLSESEQTALEEKYFTDPQAFDLMVKAENQLVDDYARGRLDPQLRQRFEQFYLAHPKRRERAKFAEALAAKLDQFERSQSVARVAIEPDRWWKRLFASIGAPRLVLASAVTLVSIVVVAAWLFTETKRLRNEVAQAQMERAARDQREHELQQQLADERTRINDLNDELSRARSQAKAPDAAVPATPTSPALVTLLLTVGGTREANTRSAPRLVIPTGTEQVRIQLNLKENDYSNYRIVLQPIHGEAILSQQGVKPRATKSGATFVVVVPARRFAAGDYILTLSGVRPDAEVDDVSKSIFHVEKK